MTFQNNLITYKRNRSKTENQPKELDPSQATTKNVAVQLDKLQNEMSEKKREARRQLSRAAVSQISILKKYQKNAVAKLESNLTVSKAVTSIEI